MRPTHLASLLLVSLAFTIPIASCIQSPTAALETELGEACTPDEPKPITEAQQESGRAYQSKDFPFVVALKDDGQGDGGGWQQADKTFHFVERSWLFPVYFWKCRMRVEMPIRCKAWGTITPSRAALWSAEVATNVVDPLLDSRSAWRDQGDEFCRELKDRLKATFDEQHPNLGVRVRYNP